MTAIVYPASLPAPAAWPTVARERRAGSDGDGIKAAPRARSRDRIADVEVQWFYTPAQMAVWVAWYEQTLLNGARWFAVRAPGPGGWLQRVCRYRTATVKREPLGGGHWRVSAQLEQRGRSVPPRVVNPPMVWVPDGPWVMSNGDKTASIGSLSNPFPHTYFNLQGSRYQSGGKVYWEVQLNDTSSSANSVGWCGFVTASGYRFACIYSGTILQSTGARPDIYALPSTNPYAGATSWGGPRTLRFAVDVDAGQLWVGNESGWLVWTGSVAPNPATGAEPLPLLNPLTEAIRPEVYHLPNLPTFTCTLRSAASQMAYPIPAGFAAIGGN